MNPAINRGKASQTLPVVIPANGKFTVKATGSHFYLVEAPHRIRAKFEGGGWSEVAPGTGLTCTGEAFFDSVELENVTAAEIAVLVYVGFAKYEDRRAEVFEPRTKVRASVSAPGGNLGAGATVSLEPVRQSGEIRRKAVTITNGDAQSRLHVLDAAGNVVLAVFPETSILLPLSEAAALQNQTGAAVEYYVSEIWWTA